VSDQGVVLLLGLEKLKNVFVMGTKVSDAMGQRLPKHTMTGLRGFRTPRGARTLDGLEHMSDNPY
jgi:hypothetical protein